MRLLRIQNDLNPRYSLGRDPDPPPDPLCVRGRDLVDVDDQIRAIPMHLAGAYLERVRRLTHRRPPPLSHRPAPALAVERHVDAGMVQRIAPPRPAVPGGKDRAYEPDDRDTAGAVVGEPVDIPPGVAVRRDFDVEARSALIAAAASRPERAAIGTPGPGCTPPPAR